MPARAPEVSRVIRHHIICTTDGCNFEGYYHYKRGKGNRPRGKARTAARDNALDHVRKNPNHLVQVKRIEQMSTAFVEENSPVP